MSLRERIAFAINPARAVQNVLHRIQYNHLKELEANSGSSVERQRSETRWRGASNFLRSMTGWRPVLGSGRSDNSRKERETTAARSFDAYRNHLVARAAATRVRTNVVGTGLTMHPDVDADALGISEEQAEELNNEILSEWACYYDNPVEVDIEATLDGAGLQSLALITALLGGDCFALTPMVPAEGSQYELKVQLIDPARVTNQNGQADTRNLLDGVEISDNGRPIAIHIRRRHPDDKFASVDAMVWDRREIFDEEGRRRILQVWNEKDRIGTTRGMPYLAPILEPLQTLEQYSRAELIAAVISAMFTVFIKRESNQFDDKGNPIPAVPGMTAKGEASGLALGNGVVMDLGPGEEAQFANPARPNSNYDPFFMAVCRQIGAALEIPLDELLLNYQASYSAARAAMLQAWRFYSMRRWWLVQQFCQPHYALWFDEAVARGKVTVTDYADPKRRAAYQKAIWIGPARGAMQEKDEVQAARDRIDAGFSNETIETAQIMGENWSTVARQRLREQKWRKANDMELRPAQGQAPGSADNPARPGQNPPGQDPENPNAPPARRQQVPEPEAAPEGGQ
jgi:lambda family phage portal protein